MLKKSRLGALMLGLLVLAGSMPAAVAAVPAAPNPDTARVWFLRPSSSASQSYGAAPMIYANGAPVAAIPDNAAFYRDFAPGTYRFTVQPYGQPTGAADIVRLTPGTLSYLEIQWAPAWEEGYASGGGASNSFFVLNLSPQIAQAYLPSLTLRGND